MYHSTNLQINPNSNSNQNLNLNQNQNQNSLGNIQRWQNNNQHQIIKHSINHFQQIPSTINNQQQQQQQQHPPPPPPPPPLPPPSSSIQSNLQNTNSITTTTTTTTTTTSSSNPANQQQHQINNHHHQQLNHLQQQQQQQHINSIQNSSFNSYPYHHQNNANQHQSIFIQSSHPNYLTSPAPNHLNNNSIVSNNSNLHQHQTIANQIIQSIPNSVPITSSWAKQVQHAQISRASSAAHHHARAAQLQIRGQASSALTITDPNRPPKPILLHYNPSFIPSGPSNSSSIHSKSTEHSDPIRHQTIQSIINSSSNTNSTTSNQGDKTDPNSPTNTSITSSSVTANPQTDGSNSNQKHQLSSLSNTGWTTVDLGGLKLKSLSDALFNYHFLTTLYIPHNSLTSLSPLISQLNSLTILDVSSNKLTSLPPELGMITTLQHLFVFHNHLTSLPPELGSLHQLEELGVEGNPLAEALMSTIQKEGTASLVAYLRDSCPVPLPPSERDWITIDSESSNLNDHHGYSPPPETFTTMCYNILCERYATDRMYGYTPSWALNWEYRKDLILQELMQYGADIICLQEVDVEQYEDFFVQSLKDQGYEGVFYPKSRARTMGSEERRHVDGCATFFKASMFQLIERECVEFNQIPMRSESHKTEDMFNRVMTKDNIAVIALLEHRQSGTRQIVANVHIHWDPEFRDVKLIQTAMLMDQLNEISNRFAKLPKRTNLSHSYRIAPSYKEGTEIPTIICGDFNSIPESGVYDYLSKGKISGNHSDFCKNNYGPYTQHGLKHVLKLKSAYSNLLESNELPFTNYTPGFKGVIDYIWYSTNSLQVIGLLGKIDDKYLRKVVGFPNAHFASDHVPVLAEFRVKPVVT